MQYNEIAQLMVISTAVNYCWFGSELTVVDYIQLRTLASETKDNIEYNPLPKFSVILHGNFSESIY